MKVNTNPDTQNLATWK